MTRTRADDLRSSELGIQRIRSTSGKLPTPFALACVRRNHPRYSRKAKPLRPIPSRRPCKFEVIQKEIVVADHGFGGQDHEISVNLAAQRRNKIRSRQQSRNTNAGPQNWLSTGTTFRSIPSRSTLSFKVRIEDLARTHRPPQRVRASPSSLVAASNCFRKVRTMPTPFSI